MSEKQGSKPLNLDIDKLKRRIVDFQNDSRIDVVIVFAICDYSFLNWKKDRVQVGPCVLLLRRGFEVADMVGQWSAIAGVDDILAEENRIGEQCARSMLVYKEIEEEIGLNPNHVKTIWMVNERDQQSPKRATLTFHQRVFLALIDPIDRVSIDHEHTGAVFVKITSLEGYFETGKTEDRTLSMVLKDGVTPDLLVNLESVIKAYRAAALSFKDMGWLKA